MEFLSNSSGIQYVFNTCMHEAVLTPIKPLNAVPASTKQNFLQRHNSLNYGSTVLQPFSRNSGPTITRSTSASLGGSNLAPRRRSMTYDPINDPHLRDFFEKKFQLSSAKRKRTKERKPGPNEVIYKVKIKTGNVNNASTDANVFLTICGKRCDLPRKHLFNKFNAIRTDHGYKFKFERNSAHVFKIIGLDVGQLTHIIIEHDGKEINNSWFLQDVTITNTKTHRVWLFECNDWLSLEHGLGKTRIQLLPSHQLEKYTHTDYQIAVVTGDKLGAGTDACVYATLFGPRGKHTPRIPLKSKERDLFERGKTDLFKIFTNYVGPIQKIRIEHDNTGKSPGWFLERIVITDLKNPKVNYFCPCGKWLDRNEDDGLICRDLVATDDPYAFRKMKKYKINVFTGDLHNAGTDADVTVILYGSLGDSGEWKLKNNENNFEKGKKDQFMIECLGVGELKKIRIGHNNKGPGAGWFLDKVIIDDLAVKRVYDFKCERWLAVDEDDGKTTIFLYPGLSAKGNYVDGEDGENRVPYTIHVHTGDVRNAGTDSKVFIELFGGRHDDKSSGRIILKGKFERGDIDICNIESPVLISPVSRVLIGHDNSGAFPSWFLNRVDLETPMTGMKQVFPCERWLAKDEDDGKIERILKENTSLREEHSSKSVWDLTVYTSNIPKAGTDSNVFVCIYGDQGKTDEIPLKAKQKQLEVGSVDKFRIEAAEIGEPFKIRVWHDNAGTMPGWHLDRIEAKNMGNKYLFICNQWLAKSEEEGTTVREMPAEGDSIRKPLPLVRYTVETYTGNKASAGTDADVFVNIFGDFGDTGDRWLEKSLNNKNKFERGKVDVFHIDAVTLKNLKKIRIGHNGKRAGAGWFLEKVVVKQEGNPKYDQTFECNRWLAVDEDDGQIVRELYALGQGSQYLDSTQYRVKVKTGDVANAGTDARVHLKIFGRKGDTGDRHLKRSDNTANKFERGREDDFTIEADDIGKIEKIKIGHNGKGLGSGWFLDYVEIDVPSKGLRYKFSAHRWLDEGEEDGKLEVELYPTEVIKLKKTVPYVVSVKTGDKRQAGTDANVFIQFYGMDGKTEEIPLKNRSNSFERGQEDVFKIEADDVGLLYKVRIGHDNHGGNAGWFLERMHIQRHATKSSKKLNTSRHSRDEPETENYYFFVDRWFAKDEDDGQLVRELIPTDERGRPLVGLEEVPYEVKVYTGDKRGAGTDANVFLTIYGLTGDTGERELKKSENINKFETNQCDTFIIKAIELDELQKIKIRHDNKGGGAAWYLERVEIFNPSTNRSYLFNCQNWLSKNEGDGKISRELPAIDPAQLKRVKFRQGANNIKEQFLLETEALTTTYNVSVATSDLRDAGTNANVYIQLFGERNDSGKVPLETSKTNRNKFERGKTDVFEVKEADVGEIRKIRIGHDGTGMGSGWHLKEVIIDAPKLGRKWKFPCGRWLDKHEDDGKIERELLPKEVLAEEYSPFVPYEITVYTSDSRGAETTANPYIVIYGEEVRTQQVELCKNKADRRDKFKRGAIDKFVIEMEDVGDKIKKIRLGHDNKGLGAGWHVDKIEIRRLKQSGKGSKIYVFPCGRWLARDEDDKQIERDLVASKILDERFDHGEVQTREKENRNRLEMKDYIVEVFTGDVSRAGTNADVFLTVFGEFGDSGEKKLIKSETHMNKFERNQMDRFTLQTADLGPLFKVYVRHDNAGISPDWYLDRIEISDTIDRQKYVFLCERWLSKSKEDKQLERTLFEKNYTGPKSTSQSSLLLKSNIGSQMTSSHSKLSIRQQSFFDHQPDYNGPTEPYKITIRTGDEKNCGISEQAFIRLYGSNDKTERIMLKLAKRKRFEPGSSEIFQIEAPDIGELRKIELGHDGVGPTENWLVKHVEVSQPTNGRSYFVTCNAWLGTEKGDGLTVRKFNIDEATSKITSFRGLIPYAMTIHTGDLPKAGTDSNVTVKVFGTKGNSEDLLVEKIENRFDRAAEDTMMIELDEIGNLKKIRVSHDGRGARKDWFLDRVELTNMKTKKQYVFVCQKWLSKSKEGGVGLTVDIPLFKHGEETIGSTNYRITVKTSDILGAGTDAKVFVTLFGENGDSGELELKKSEKNMNKFERNQTDVFLFNNMLSLGEFTKLRVRHDNSGNLIGNAHWHLEYIKVEDVNSQKTFKFDCNKWISKSKDDKQLVRELKPNLNESDARMTPRIGDRTSYEVIVQTADERNAGTIQNVELVVVGESGQDMMQMLENTNKSKILRRGQTDKFLFKSRSIGNLKKIYLRHVERPDQPESREERGAAWICEQVVVRDLGSDTTFVFPIRDGLVLNAPPKPFRCESKKENSVVAARSLENVKYEVFVHTGEEKGAGTNAKAYITIYGEHGDSGKRPLKKGFDRSQTEKFTVECIDLGHLKKVHIEHDNSSFKKDWFLDRVEIIDQHNKTFVFPCNKWLSKTKEDGEIGRDLFPLVDQEEEQRSRGRENSRGPSRRGGDYDEKWQRGGDDRGMDRIGSSSPFRERFRYDHDDFSRDRDRQFR